MTSQKFAIVLIAVALFVGSMTVHADDFNAGVKAYELYCFTNYARTCRPG